MFKIDDPQLLIEKCTANEFGPYWKITNFSKIIPISLPLTTDIAFLATYGDLFYFYPKSEKLVGIKCDCNGPLPSKREIID